MFKENSLYMICTVSHSTDHIFNNFISEFIYLNVTVILQIYSANNMVSVYRTIQNKILTNLAKWVRFTKIIIFSSYLQLTMQHNTSICWYIMHQILLQVKLLKVCPTKILYHMVRICKISLFFSMSLTEDKILL